MNLIFTNNDKHISRS